MITTQFLVEELKNTEVEYISDTSWCYTIKKDDVFIGFYQDEQGNNHIEQFAVKKDSIWFEIIPTDEQIKIMWEKLNNTQYRNVEEDETDPFWMEDNYENLGLTPEMFF